MEKPRLTYFDLAGSRGEECRLALHLAGVSFEDRRLNREQWGELKPTMPYGSIPVLELPGRLPLAHTNAILVYLGRQHELHPKDDFEAARHEGLMNHVEDLRAHVGPSLRIGDPAEKQRVREELARDYLPKWAGYAERHLGDGPFVAGERLHVVDLKLFIAVRWFASGTVDHIPSTVFSDFRKLTGVYEAVKAEPRVVAWYAR